jgi:centrosomal protein CEP104
MSAQIPLNEIKFKRLGYLSLDSNERSGFQARELKSVYVDSVSLLLKVVLHKCHVNKFNLFN